MRHAFSQAYKKGITGTAALLAFHVHGHTECHKDKTRKHYDNTEWQAFIQLKRIERIVKLNKVARQKSIYDCTKADFFL